MKKAHLTDAGEPAVLDTETGELEVVSQPYRTILRDHFGWKTPFNHDTDAESFAHGLTCKDPSRTQHQFAKDADINVILAKFMSGGELPLQGTPQYLDNEETELSDILVTQYQVDQAWEKLPKAAKDLLGNPARFMNYVESAIRSGDTDALRRVDLLEAATGPAEPSAPPGGSPAPEDGKGAPAPSKAP